MASKIFKSPDAKERHRVGSAVGGVNSADVRRAMKAKGMAAAIEWRESGRCHCGALAYQPCVHRPEGLSR